ncbi:MAG: hypothetical protein PHN99_08510 [Eubacteriales bacterium]|nr:hypothetical protein [Eubacteriales bacterium]MDD4718134.1 hypothetical protein [Eubacteriales bacterium]
MNQITTSGIICLRDDLGLEYRVAEITYTEKADGSFSYVFTPNYSVIDLLSPPEFQGIPGLDLDLRKPQYIRENMTPVFISERSPGENRENLWELLEEVGMKYLNRLEWLIRTTTRYSGDRMYVKRLTDEDLKHCVTIHDPGIYERAVMICERILKIICYGNDVRTDGFSIDDSNRKAFYSLLIPLYRNEKFYSKQRRVMGISDSVAAGKYRGRKRIQIEDTKAFEVFRGFRSGRITESEALKILNVSRATFYRRLKEFSREI